MNNKNNKISQFDELFKQGLENHSVNAPSGVFMAVSAGASSVGASAAKLAIAKWIIGGLLAIGAASTVYYLSDAEKSQDEITAVETSPVTVVEGILSESASQETLNKIEQEQTIAIGADNKIDERTVSAGTPKPKLDSYEESSSKANIITNPSDKKGSSTKQQLNEKLIPTYARQIDHFISIIGNVCAGSSFNMHLNTTKSVDWFVNHEKLNNSNAQITYQFLQKQPYAIEAYIQGKKVADTFINMSAPKVTIQSTDLGSGVNQLSANTSGIRAAVWEYNGNALSSDRRFAYDALLYATVPYLVTTDKHGCKDTFEATKSNEKAQFEFIQTVITPNGDGKNDDYEISISGYETFTMIISDPNGKPIFTTNNPKIHWKGINQITKLPCENGTYVVFVNYKLKNSTNEVKEYDKVLLTK